MSAMRAPRDVHRTATRALSAAMVVLGVAIIVRTLVAGGGALAVGLILGVLFVVAGAGRLWVAGLGRGDRS
jgi:multisubunit Na+/H+ antiporter MnhB subunit